MSVTDLRQGVKISVVINDYALKAFSSGDLRYTEIDIDTFGKACVIGHPKLPERTILIQLPVGATSVALVEDEGAVLQPLDDGLIVPCVGEDGKLPSRYQDLGYPYKVSSGHADHALFRVGETQTWAGTKVVAVTLSPVIFYPDEARSEMAVDFSATIRYEIGLEPREERTIYKGMAQVLAGAIENYALDQFTTVSEQATVLVVGEEEALATFEIEYLASAPRNTCFAGSPTCPLPGFEAGPDQQGLFWKQLPMGALATKFRTEACAQAPNKQMCLAAASYPLLTPEYLKREIRSEYGNGTNGYPLTYVVFLGDDAKVPLGRPVNTGLFGTEFSSSSWVEISGHVKYDPSFPYWIVDYLGGALDTDPSKIQVEFGDCGGPPVIGTEVPCTDYQEGAAGVSTYCCRGSATPMGFYTAGIHRSLDLGRPECKAVLIEEPYAQVDSSDEEILENCSCRLAPMYPVSQHHSSHSPFEEESSSFSFGDAWRFAVTCAGRHPECTGTPGPEGGWVPFSVRFRYVGPGFGSALGTLKIMKASEETVVRKTFSEYSVAPKHIAPDEFRYNGQIGHYRARVFHTSEKELTGVQWENCAEGYCRDIDVDLYDFSTIMPDDLFPQGNPTQFCDLIVDNLVHKQWFESGCHPAAEFVGYGSDCSSNACGTGEMYPLFWNFTSVASDFYYQQLDYNETGGMSFTPSVFLGRIPISDALGSAQLMGSTAQLSEFLAKLKQNESVLYHMGTASRGLFGRFVLAAREYTDLGFSQIESVGLYAAKWRNEESLSRVKVVVGLCKPSEPGCQDGETGPVFDEWLARLAGVVNGGVFFGVTGGHGASGMTDNSGKSEFFNRLDNAFAPLWFLPACVTNNLENRLPFATSTQHLLLRPTSAGKGGMIGVYGTAVNVQGDHVEDVASHAVSVLTEALPGLSIGEAVELVRGGYSGFDPCGDKFKYVLIDSFAGMPMYSLDRISDFDGDGQRNSLSYRVEGPDDVPLLLAGDGRDTCDWEPWALDIEPAEADAVTWAMPGVFSDRIGDFCDNCPFCTNPGQEDSDLNGVGDACETGEPSDVNRQREEPGLPIELYPPGAASVDLSGLGELPAGKYRLWIRVFKIAGPADAQLRFQVYEGTSIPVERVLQVKEWSPTSQGLEYNLRLQFEVPAGGKFRARLRADGASSFVFRVERIRLIPEQSPFQVGYCSEDAEGWVLKDGAWMGRADSPTLGEPEWWWGFYQPALKGYAVYIEANENAGYVFESSISCPAELEELAIGDGAYLIRFSYVSFVKQPVGGKHIIEVCGKPYEFGGDSNLTDGARMGVAIIDNQPGCVIRFCQQGYGKYAIDNIIINQLEL